MTRPKLLLADDSVTIRKVIELTFADEGIDVTSVADGAAAMSKFVETQPDIVLVDAGLPGTSGYQLCEMIKGDESTSHIPVLLLVGSFEPFDQDAAENAGADGFLTKPFHSIRELVNRVKELLGEMVAATPAEDIPVGATDSDPLDDAKDIDDLYERSFAETQPIENYETVPAFSSEEVLGKESFADAPTIDASHHSVEEWLDDEMIETIRTPNDDTEPSVDPIVEEMHGQAAKDILSGGETETKEYPVSDVGDQHRDLQEDEIRAAGDSESSPAAAIDIEPIKEFDWSPAAIVTSADEAEIGAAAGFAPAFLPEESLFPPAFDESLRKTEEIPDLPTEDTASHAEESDTGEQAMQEESVQEPSREMIDLIARRVIERLSDRVIREIAQEAVPRIAEKMMREALEEEGKN